MCHSAGLDPDNTSKAQCWANTVSACGDAAHAHDVRRGVFPAVNVTIAGPAPLPLDLRTADLESSVTQTLCAKHNEALCDLDRGLLDLVNALRETERLRKVRKHLRAKWPAATRLVVDGPRIERWVLKRVMSYAALLRAPLNDWRPPEWLPEVIFGSRKLGERCGLALLARVGDRLTAAEGMGFTFGLANDNLPCAVVLEVRQGWKFLCTWERSIDSLGGEARLHGQTYLLAEDALFHPRRAEFEHEKKSLGVSLDFDWSGSWTERTCPAVVKLRRGAGPPSP